MLEIDAPRLQACAVIAQAALKPVPEGRSHGRPVTRASMMSCCRKGLEVIGFPVSNLSVAFQALLAMHDDATESGPSSSTIAKRSVRATETTSGKKMKLE